MPGKTTPTKRKPRKRPQRRKPRVLVLEAAGGSATRAVQRSGATPMRINPRDLSALDEALAAGKFDGLLLTGGGDLDPRLYGEKPHKQVYGVNETRDYAEWVTLDRAHELGVPIMGICRGMQMIAVHNGGKLRQHVTGHRGNTHAVTPEPDSAFGIVTGEAAPAFPSLHHQLVVRHGGRYGMRVGARSREGYIEAIEGGRLGRSGPRILAVQFHPEYDYETNEASRRLFDWLAQASAKKAGLAKPERTRLVSTTSWGTPKRKATAKVTAGKRGNPRRYETRFFCRECGLEFDKQQDRDDHEYWICGDPQMRLTEPPPGHPDWITGHDDPLVA